MRSNMARLMAAAVAPFALVVACVNQPVEQQIVLTEEFETVRFNGYLPGYDEEDEEYQWYPNPAVADFEFTVQLWNDHLSQWQALASRLVDPLDLTIPKDAFPGGNPPFYYWNVDEVPTPPWISWFWLPCGGEVTCPPGANYYARYRVVVFRNGQEYAQALTFKVDPIPGPLQGAWLCLAPKIINEGMSWKMAANECASSEPFEIRIFRP